MGSSSQYEPGADLSAEHRANLERLAAHLESLPASGVRDDHRFFDMQMYAVRYGGRSVVTALPRTATHCGTVCCAAGHGPAAGLPAEGHEDWVTYTQRVFGVGGLDDRHCWMFAGAWFMRDNTPAGAAARIRWLLAHGVPLDVWEQITGQAPLCYRTHEEHSA